ncbi:MAG: hypothetical protein H0V56_01005 [Chthoniobacterales bacterium]|nr:hypothetical protein [Chthoniobacterales bacterium]
MPAAIKSTFSLDTASIERLKRLSRHWQVSKTEAIRRALAEAEKAAAPTPEQRIDALHQLQRLTAERGVDLEKWQQTIKNGRR